MPRRDDAPRDLLFGLLALQNGMVSKAQLVAAFGAWTASPGRSMADLLVEQGALDPAGRDLLLALTERHLRAHGGDPEKSLAALELNRSTREGLAAAGGPDVEASLAHVESGSTEPGADRTATYAVGTAAADGRRFRVLRPHAKGGLGAVFVALDEELHREVALKEILDRHADDPASRRRFLLEAEITGGLEHPGIVPVYGLGTHADGRPYYAMRFIKGDSLKEAIAAFHADASLRGDPGRRSLELRKHLRRFLDVCNAIDYAHSRGVLHRDVKPSNVIVGRHGETLVVDWGLAKPLGRREPGAADERTLVLASSGGSAETLPGSALGTPGYMSPEQAAGDLERLGPRSDVYSLGATLFCLLTGLPPFAGEAGEVLRHVQAGAFPRPRALDPGIDRRRTLNRLRTCHVPRPRVLDPGIDRALEAVCLKAMALKPEDRYPTPRALADDVERWMADEPVSAWREPFTLRARRWARRHRPAVTGAAVAVPLLSTIVALAVATAVVSRQRSEAVTARYNTLKALIEAQKVRDAAWGVRRRLATLAAANESSGRWADAEPLRRGALDLGRTDNSARFVLAVDLVALGLNLLNQSKWSEAEPPLRECLAICEQVKMPNDWLRFSSIFLLGEALAGQGRYDEAEPLVVAGYEGMKAHTAIPPSLKPRLVDEAMRVVRLYEAWGKPEQARAWKERLGLADLPADVFARP
jgi:serine/threonine-protein kinase